MTQKY